jgi:hypothetical protein
MTVPLPQTNPKERPWADAFVEGGLCRMPAP